MFKKLMIMALGALLASAPAEGMSYLRRWASPAIVSATAAYSSYFTQPVQAFGMPEGQELKDYPETAKFMAKYRCSAQLEAEKDKHFLKDDVTRLMHAERMKGIIEWEGLDRFKVAEKCLCKMGDGDYRVLSKRLEWKSPYQGGAHLSLSEVQQAAVLAKRSGYNDWHGDNVRRTADGRIGICDTEEFSFNDKNRYRFKNVCKGNSDLICEVESKKWLKEKQNQDQYGCDEGVGFGIAMSQATRSVRSFVIALFTEEPCDFEKVKQELREFAKEKRIN